MHCAEAESHLNMKNLSKVLYPLKPFLSLDMTFIVCRPSILVQYIKAILHGLNMDPSALLDSEQSISQSTYLTLEQPGAFLHEGAQPQCSR